VAHERAERLRSGQVHGADARDPDRLPQGPPAEERQHRTRLRAHRGRALHAAVSDAASGSDLEGREARPHHPARVPSRLREPDDRRGRQCAL